MSGAIANKIRTRGYWRVVIRPTTFRERVPSFKALRSTVERCSVQVRGWDFPHISDQAEALYGSDWVGQDTDWMGFVEAWRAYTSGQFVDLSGFFDDWADEGGALHRRTAAWRPGQSLGVEEVVNRYTEIFEFAARWALSDAGASELHLAVEAHGLMNRTLVIADPRRLGFRVPYVSNIPLWKPMPLKLSRETLVSESAPLALRAAKELLMRFGWEPPTELLTDWQQQLLTRGTNHR